MNPDLVGRDEEGNTMSVRYEAVNAMLLNEFLKQHGKVQEQEGTIRQLKATLAKQEATNTQQQSEIKALTASVREQASAIQKVSARLEARQPTAQIAVNSR